MVENAELEALMTGNWLTDLANFCAFYYHSFPNINWIGFYLSDGEKLRLGPFQGKPACTEIAFTRGVCGAAFTNGSPVIVDDVNAFPGHITCDPDSKSELVIPLFYEGKAFGVLDIDSAQTARFRAEDIGDFQKAIDVLLLKNKNLKGYPKL